VCPLIRRVLEAARKPFSAFFDNLRRLAGVINAGARCQNPDPERVEEEESVVTH